MPYVGNKPEVGNYRKADSISVVNGQATYNLLVGGVAVNPNQNQVITSLNGVIQSSGDSYTIANSQITFVSNLQTGDVIDFILILGDTLDVGTVSDDTISAAKIQTDAVTQAKIADEAIDEARLQISNAGSNGQFLSKQSGDTGGLTWADAGGASDDYFASSGLSAKDLGSGLHVKTGDSGQSTLFQTNDNKLVLEDDGEVSMTMLGGTTSGGHICMGASDDADALRMTYDMDNNRFLLYTEGTERFRILDDGDIIIGKTSQTFSTAGTEIYANGDLRFTAADNAVIKANRTGGDGEIFSIYNDGSLSGTISFSGGTVSYNTFCGSHWSRLADNSKPTILRGTVMDSISTMCDWYQAEATDDNGNKIIENIALPDGKSVGDAVTFTSNEKEYTGVYVKEDNQQLPMSKISDTEDSKAVYGVFMDWDDKDDGLDGDVNDMNVASLGAYVVRIHKDETVAIGDYLQSKGDGTAKKQADDILRASTIGKVTSTEKTITHADGSYCVPCTLHCG